MGWPGAFSMTKASSTGIVLCFVIILFYTFLFFILALTEDNTLHSLFFVFNTLHLFSFFFLYCLVIIAYLILLPSLFK